MTDKPATPLVPLKQLRMFASVNLSILVKYNMEKLPEHYIRTILTCLIHKLLTNYLSMKTIVCFSEAFGYEPHQNTLRWPGAATRAMRPNEIHQSNTHTHNCSAHRYNWPIQLNQDKYIIRGGKYKFNSIGVYLKLETSTAQKDTKQSFAVLNEAIS